jgi:hypothetical protein
MTLVEQVGIIALNMLVDFISGGEFLDEFEVEMSFKDRRCTRGKEVKSDDMNFFNEVVDGKQEREGPVLNTKHRTVHLTIATPVVLQYRVYLPTSEKQNSRNSQSSS